MQKGGVGMQDDFSTLDICKALKIERERLRSWIKKDFIKPSIPAEGAGTRASFTRLDVYKIAVFKALLEKGQSRTSATYMTNNLYKVYDDVQKLGKSANKILYIMWRFTRKEKELRLGFATLTSNHPPEDSKENGIWW
jgi:hypothetical protein